MRWSKKAKEDIYKRYLTAYKEGVYNFIREDADQGTGEIVPRKYFSGGLNLNVVGKIREIWNVAKISIIGKLNLLRRNAYLLKVGELPTLQLGFTQAGPDYAMSAEVQKVFFDTETVLKAERKVSPKVQKIMNETDSLIIPLVTEYPVSLNESLEKINLSEGYIEFRNCRVGLNIKTANDETLEDGGTTKGGIRYYVEGTELFNEKPFREGWERLNALHAPIEDFREFISMYMRNGAWNLAFLMFEKVKLLGLPLGGAKADVFIGNVVQEGDRIVIKNLPKKDKEKALKLIAKRHGEILAPYVGIGKDSPAPDVATADLMGIYAEEGIMWLMAHKPQDFEPDLLEQLRIKQREVATQPDDFPLGEKTPLLEILDNYATQHHVPMGQVGVYSGTKKHGGLIGRTEATGIGVINVLMKYLTEQGIDFKGMKISLQGMGAVGYYAALHAIENGFLVTHFSDKNIAVIKEDGWRPGELDKIFAEIVKRRDLRAKELREKSSSDIKGTNWWDYYLEDLREPPGKRIFAFAGVRVILNQEIEGSDKYKRKEKEITNTILHAPVDVLVPAFLGDQITEENWEGITARFIAEGANHPIDNIALIELTKRGEQIILPGILSNANGVYSSYLQILQALRGIKFTLAEVQQMGRSKLESVTQDVMRIQKQHPELTIGEACELLAWKNAARDQLRVVIQWERGELNNILKHYPGTTEEVIKQRIKALGLRAEFHNYLTLNLQELQLSIINHLHDLLDIVEIEHIFYLTEPPYNGFAESMALTRTLDNILKGETVSEAVKRLKTMGYDVVKVRKLRSDLLEKN